MSKEVAVIVLGVWVVILTQLGIPGSWRTTLLILTGAGLVILGFFLRAESLGRSKQHSSNHSFVENGHTPPHDRKDGITSLN